MVIFDEAHELEDVAGNYFGISVSSLRVDELARDVERAVQQHKMMSASVSGAIGSLRERSQLFFSVLPSGDGRFAFEGRREFLEENGDEFIGLNQSLTRLAGELEGLQQKPEEIFNLRSPGAGNPGAIGIRTRIGRSQHRFLDRAPRRSFTTEARRYRENKRKLQGPSARLPAGHTDRCRPILRECLWAKLDCAVLTSATLAVGGGFDYIRQTPRIRPCARTRSALALRLSEPGRALRSARPARSAHAAVHRQGC